MSKIYKNKMTINDVAEQLCKKFNLQKVENKIGNCYYYKTVPVFDDFFGIITTRSDYKIDFKKRRIQCYSRSISHTLKYDETVLYGECVSAIKKAISSYDSCELVLKKYIIEKKLENINKDFENV